tara:strand:- start:306 stop:590 length:285 start_codon:yes stop_codon:yes gene_type:complete
MKNVLSSFFIGINLIYLVYLQHIREQFQNDLEIDFSSVLTFNLDEYTDLPVEHSESYRTFMMEVREKKRDQSKLAKGLSSVPPWKEKENFESSN